MSSLGDGHLWLSDHVETLTRYLDKINNTIKKKRGDDKLEIQQLARRIGTYDISAEPFHDCCPMFQSKSPALFATPKMLDEAEETLDVASLVERAMSSLTVERFQFTQGKIERQVLAHKATA